MSSPAALTQPEAERAGTGGSQRLRAILFRRIWLPRPLYAALPWLYAGAGSSALFGGLFLPDSSWPIPYAVLFGLACLHAGASIAALRRRRRRPGGQRP